MQKRRINILLLCILITAALLVFNANIFAQEHEDDHHDRGRHYGWYKHQEREHRDERYHRREYRDEHGWNRRDDNYRRIYFGDRDYYFHRGEFYERRPSGYVVVTTPFGIEVPYLPRGYRIIRHRGIRFYFFGGIYYRLNPSTGVYFVVKAPF